MKVHPLDLCLGPDQVGELYGEVFKKLQPREVFMAEEIPALFDKMVVKIHGSRGTTLRAELKDSGWSVRRWPARQ